MFERDRIYVYIYTFGTAGGQLRPRRSAPPLIFRCRGRKLRRRLLGVLMMGGERSQKDCYL
jgi:hypothetical protein